MAELPEGAMQPDQAAAIATGVRLRTYKFDRYKTKKKDGEERGCGPMSRSRSRMRPRRKRPSRRTRPSSMA